jgi:hypothetical protein
MNHTYRVRFTLKPRGERHRAADVESLDLQTGLEDIPAGLPVGAYILYVEDLTAGQNIHWTRWPNSYRPGFGG